jgi:hypothetical protein
VGDILEYISLVDSWQANYQKTYYFASDYSIVGAKIIFEYEPDNFMMAQKCINNCPPFRMTKSKSNIVYTIEDTMRMKYVEELEDIPALTEPHFKIHVIPKRLRPYFGFQFTNGTSKTKITEDDLKNEVYTTINKLSESNSEYYIDFIEKYGYHQSDAEYLRTYFYYMRDHFFTESVTFYDKPKSSGLSLMNKLIRGAQKRKIPFEIVLMKDKDEGPFDDLLFEDELYWAVIFKTSEGELSFYSFHLFSHPNEIPSDYEGTEAYRFKIGSSAKNTQITKFTIPSTSSEKNTYHTLLNVQFDNGIDSVNVVQRCILKGYYRNNIKFDLINRNDYFYAYLNQLREFKIIQNNDLRYYFVTYKAYNNFNKTFIDNEELRGRELFKVNQSNNLKQYFEQGHRKERYKLLKFKEYKIISDSRSPDSNWVEWEEKLSIGDIVKQVNQEFLVLEVGKIFSGMYQINGDRNREVRTKPIFIKYNRSIISDLSIKLPDGYKIKDVTKLNKKFENTLGSFTTTASTQGNMLTINLNKTYKANTYQKENWSDYISFLDAAAAYNQTKIILEKK